MANTAQSKWLKTITDWYQSGGYQNDELNECYRMQRHHVVGRKGKHNKIDIGHWFVIPLPYVYHDIRCSDDPLNVTYYHKAFTKYFGLQSELFSEMIKSMVEHGIELPFGDDVINAIEDTRR